MGITIDNSIRLLEDYHKWKHQFGIYGSGVDNATNKLLEVAKKYQKIEQIIKDHDNDIIPEDYWYIDRIKEVVEDGNDRA